MPDACAVAEMLQGDVDYALQAQNGPDGKPYGYHYSGFGQTEWKIRRDLTVTAGLRYELNTPFQDATNQLGNFNYKVPGGQLVVNPNENINPLWKEAVGNTPFVSASSVGLGPGLRYTYWSNIQPRLGFAWKPSSKTVVRASAGIYSVPVLGAVLYSLLGIDTSYYGTYQPTESTPILNFSNVFGGTPGVSSFPGYRRANQWNLKDPRVYQWNAAFEQNIGFQTLLRLSYTGSHAVDLIYSPDLNQVAPNTASYTDPSTGATVYGYKALVATPALRQQNLKFPNFFEVLTRNNGPSDKYEAFMIELNRRFAQGLSFTNSYTLSYEHRPTRWARLRIRPLAPAGKATMAPMSTIFTTSLPIWETPTTIPATASSVRWSMTCRSAAARPTSPTPAAPKTSYSAAGMSPESPCSVRASGRLLTTRAVCMTLRVRTPASAR